MSKFKLSVGTREEWVHDYEVEAKDLEEAKAMVEQEIIEPVKSHREYRMITGIMED